jgi:hypothetical protein
MIIILLLLLMDLQMTIYTQFFKTKATSTQWRG